ncbi:MAG: hypothetical protein J6M66_09210 [Lachnospiraceae bacterium]|nr:hypothetical protein [Lachnospiraceae bacterium]
MNSDEYSKQLNGIECGIDNIIKGIDTNYNETSWVHNIIKNTPAILDDLDDQFQKATHLTKTDTALLFVAIGLQVVRQYLVTNFQERLSDQEAAQNTLGHTKEESNRSHRLYNPSLEEIIKNPVPFDANIGSNGALKGGGSFGHRGATLGHDPILGYIFGTANIATSTLTNIRMQSYHIYTTQVSNGRSEYNRDYFKSKARTDLVLKYTLEKAMHQGLEGKRIVGTSLWKEFVHLNSDKYSKDSLPLPFTTIIDSNLASELASYGLDMANVTTVLKQAYLAAFINFIISMIHRLLFDGAIKDDLKLYEVRTRKILSYSNSVATSTNLIYSFVSEDYSKLDIGGFAVTIARLISDQKFIRKVKEEFIYGQYQDMINGI